jgi:hypothetical protein
MEIHVSSEKQSLKRQREEMEYKLESKEREIKELTDEINRFVSSNNCKTFKSAIPSKNCAKLLQFSLSMNKNCAKLLQFSFSMNQ